MSQPLWVNGSIGLSDDDNAIDLRVIVEDLGLGAVKPFVSSFASDVKGQVEADLTVRGTLQSPNLSGYLNVDNGALKIDYLGVTYSFSDSIFVDSTSMRLNNFVIRDQNGNEAVANGEVSHNHFKDIGLNITLNSRKLLCMNTGIQAGAYYGTILAAVDGSVRGRADDINVVLNARTLNGSALHIPINNKRQAQTADYIVFTDDFSDDLFSEVATDTNSIGTVVSEEVSSSRFKLTINVEATSDMSVYIPVDITALTAEVAARGEGDLQLTVSSEEPFALSGDYEITSGTVMLNLAGLISKEFTVEEGSTVSFPGAISDSRLDINAVYSQRVNMSSLTGSLGNLDAQKPITVENVISITQSLQSPVIGFDIRLPNADQTVQEEVFAYIDRNNDRDMLNQTMSLLAFGQFYNSSSGNTTSLADRGYSAVANTLGSLVSGMVQVVDVNFDYKAGNSLTTEQYDIDISKEWRKFYFETTFGFGGESREMSSVSNNNMTGDVLVGYKINPRLHLFVFNRSNTNDYTRSDLPYKQGVGLKYTRDFDRFVELFHRSKQKEDK